MIENFDAPKRQQIDRSGMINHILGLPRQIEEASSLTLPTGDDLKGLRRIELNALVIAGMGGSAIGGDLLKAYLGDQLRFPAIVNRGYRLPGFASQRTLVLAASYSGNTEETIAAFEEALERDCKTVAITSGGRLLEMARAKSVPTIEVPAGISPRCALGYLFVPALRLLELACAIGPQQEAISEAASELRHLAQGLHPDSGTDSNLAKRLAVAIGDSIPIIYGSFDNTDAVAMRWKTQINENSKWPAFFNVIPEADHNEIVGFELGADVLKNFTAIFLEDRDDGQKVKRRMEVTKKLIAEAAGEVLEVASSGNTRLSRLLGLAYIGDFTSYYLALLKAVDPMPVRTVELLKKELASRLR